MLVRQMHRNWESVEWEIIKWVAIISLAAALSLLLTRASANALEASTAAKPAPLPTAITDWARPMQPEARVTSESAQQALIWRALQWHRSANPAEAIAAWRLIRLPAETGVWKYVALADAHLALRQNAEAAMVLTTAADLSPHHPLVHYYTGLVRLTEAAQTDGICDRGPGSVQLAVMPHVPPNARSMFLLAAMMEFEAAIEHAESVHPEEILLRESAELPRGDEATVGDLLAALDIEQFVGKSHNTLGGLSLERGAWEVAESHFDAATVEGLAVIYGYRDLGRAYEEEGRYLDASRAYLKAARAEGGAVSPLRRALHNFGRALGELF